MHDYLLSLILGVVEGLTEFLPVSSTAHLRIAESILAINLQDGFWKMYSIVIQLGAILALPVYFRARLLKFIRTFPTGEAGDRTIVNHPLSLVIQRPWGRSLRPRHRTIVNHPLSLVMVAFLVTAIPAFLLSKVIGKNLESIRVMALSLLIGGIVMWVVDAFFRKPRILRMEAMNLANAVWIGAVQILSAVFPGTSRSMCTIAAGQVSGLSREAALEFSFFLSIPTMVVATGYTLLKTLHPGHRVLEATSNSELTPAAMNGHGWAILSIGFVVSFIVALGVIAWFMNWVRRRGFALFAIYRIALGLYLLIAVHPS